MENSTSESCKIAFLHGSERFSKDVVDKLQKEILGTTDCQKVVIVGSGTTIEEVALRARPNCDIIVTVAQQSSSAIQEEADENRKNLLFDAKMFHDKMRFVEEDFPDLRHNKKIPAQERGGKIPFYRHHKKSKRK